MHYCYGDRRSQVGKWVFREVDPATGNELMEIRTFGELLSYFEKQEQIFLERLNLAQGFADLHGSRFRFAQRDEFEGYIKACSSMVTSCRRNIERYQDLVLSDPGRELPEPISWDLFPPELDGFWEYLTTDLFSE